MSDKNKTAMQYGLIRHAKTLWNLEKRIQGQQDSPLSQDGKKMAADWGPLLATVKWDRIICSDLERAHHTAEIINRDMQLPIVSDRRLREQDWGGWCGQTLKEVKKKYSEPLHREVRSGWDFRPPGGESRSEVLGRSKSALADAHDAAQWSPPLVAPAPASVDGQGARRD